MKTGFVLALLLSLSPLCHARPTAWVGGNVGTLGGNDETESGLIGGGQVGVAGRHLGASFHALHYGGSNKVKTLSKGTLSLTPLMFNVFGRIPLTEDVSLRLGGGASRVQVSHDLDSEVTALFNSLGFLVKEDVKSGLGYQIMAGADFKISKNVSVGADLFYLFFKPELNASLTSMRSGATLAFKDEVKLDTFIGMANIKFHFGGDAQ